MSYGLHGLDKKLLKYLNFSNGVFVEAGANDGISQSNTALYEFEYGWTGLLIEPNFQKYLECKRNRKQSIVENYALVSHNYKMNTISGNFNQTGYVESLTSLVYDSGDWCDEYLKQNKEQIVDNLVDVPAITLTKLLEKNNLSQIDFISLDVEGYEISVLNGLDFSRFSPKFFLVETTTYENRKLAIIDYMFEKGYNILMDEELGVNDVLFGK